MTYEEWFEHAKSYQEILSDIWVAVPARPHDGICLKLCKMLSLWAMSGIAWGDHADSMGGFIEVTRCRIVVDFLRNHQEKYLLMIDNDVEPDIQLPYLLSRHDLPVVGSCIPSMNAKGRAMLCFSKEDRHGQYRFVDYDDGDKIPAKGLVQVPHVGTGAMMIRRDVLESFTMKGEDVPFIVPNRIRYEGAVNGILMKGEDIWFCSQARAKGYDLHVDLEAHCGHRKTMRMAFPPQLRDPSLRVEDWEVSTEGMILSK
jgi:hypothetical protein